MATNSYYEAHITMDTFPNVVYLEDLTKELGWKFSRIDGDPNLGNGVKCYATKQFNGNMYKGDVLGKLLTAAAILEHQGARILRRKVELVLYDDRSSKVRFECNGACPECHTEENYAG